MNNYSDSQDITIDPLKFLELKKSEILFKLTTEIGYSEEKAISKFNLMTDIINRLKPLRAFKSQTIDFLEETIKHISYKSKSFILNFLIKAVISKATYCHAYNSLANLANRDLVIPFPANYIPEHELLARLENEETPKCTDSGNTLKQLPESTFNTSLSLAELNTVRLRLIRQQKINKISEADFNYLFSEQPVHLSMVKIYWNDSRCLCHAFLMRIVYNESKFCSPQVNNCISFKDGKKIDSSFKSKAQYKNDDFLNQLLLF